MWVALFGAGRIGIRDCATGSDREGCDEFDPAGVFPASPAPHRYGSATGLVLGGAVSLETGAAGLRVAGLGAGGAEQDSRAAPDPALACRIRGRFTRTDCRVPFRV